MALEPDDAEEKLLDNDGVGHDMRPHKPGLLARLRLRRDGYAKAPTSPSRAKESRKQKL